MEVQSTYIQAIQEAGGIPLLLPPMPDEDLDQLTKKLSGLLCIGGGDYDPSRYGQKPHESLGLTHPDREDFDFRLLKKILKQTEIPILGICLGSQLLNITCGGTLIQDIATNIPDSVVKHTSENGWKNGFHRHSVKIKKDSLLSNFYMEEVAVPTSHHQAVGKIGEGLEAVAFAEDGIIEGIEMPGRSFTLGVQWHPERDIETSKNLFAGFVRSAHQYCA
jgi:gamma-glutamyl-gamma-aminobutyrate hydrolase PuuD